MEYKKGKLLYEGKTKKVWQTEPESDFIIIENKEDITAYDNPEYTKKFSSKAVYATTTACRVFELLKNAGLPVAYERQLSPVEFLAPKCAMIPLEAVPRRYAVGSYLKRHPELAGAGKVPHRFHRLATEFFLKTTDGRLERNGEVLVQGLDKLNGEEDPFIANQTEEVWPLYHSKKPAHDPAADLKRQIKASLVLPGGLESMKNLDKILRQTFLILESAWGGLGLRMIDMKAEFGLTKDNKILIADVIDNDSWRLRDANWEELSKEAFRQGEALDEVEKKYGLVASLVERFRIPKQAVIFWRGSEKDELPILKNEYENKINIKNITLSGHKATGQCLKELERVMAEYPDGGVIIAKVGMSNGLGPILAAHTAWPVITIPKDYKEFPLDAWSSLRAPSDVPLATICSDANAVDYALNILAQKNPLLYMLRQSRIEELDN